MKRPSGFRSSVPRFVPFDECIHSRIADPRSEAELDLNLNPSSGKENCSPWKDPRRVQWCREQWRVLLTTSEWSVTEGYLAGFSLCQVAALCRIETEEAALNLATAVLLLRAVRARPPQRRLSTAAGRLAAAASCCGGDICSGESCPHVNVLNGPLARQMVRLAAARFIVRPCLAEGLIEWMGLDVIGKCELLSVKIRRDYSAALESVATASAHDAKFRKLFLSSPERCRTLFPLSLRALEKNCRAFLDA